MNPHLTLALAEERIADMHREAAASRLATAARRAHGAAASRVRARRAGRLIWSLRGRRYRQIELVWPDGVCSVVPARSDDTARPLTGSRK
jgi:hypothetical protein